MERHKPSRKPEPEHQPIEPEMEKRPDEDPSGRNPATEPPKDKRVDNL